MRSDRRCILRIADYRQHLPQSHRRTAFDQFVKQCLANTESDRIVRYINRILDGTAISRARTKLIGVRIAGDTAVALGDQVRKSGLHDVRVTCPHLLRIRRLGLERAETIRDVMRVDRLDSR